MLITGEQIYLLNRERQSRDMARRARDPAVRYVHTALADAYALRAGIADTQEPSQKGAGIFRFGLSPKGTIG